MMHICGPCKIIIKRTAGREREREKEEERKSKKSVNAMECFIQFEQAKHEASFGYPEILCQCRCRCRVAAFIHIDFIILCAFQISFQFFSTFFLCFCLHSLSLSLSRAGTISLREFHGDRQRKVQRKKYVFSHPIQLHYYHCVLDHVHYEICYEFCIRPMAAAMHDEWCTINIFNTR